MKEKRTVVEPGKSSVLLVNLRSGRYVIWCTMPGHATRGMRTSLTLVGATAGSTSTTTDDTTTSQPIPGY